MEKTIYCCLPPHPPFPTRFPTVCVYNCDFERVQVFHSLDNLDFLELDAIYCFLQTVSRNALLATCNIIQGVSKKSEFSENQLWQILLWLVRNPCGIFDKSLLSAEIGPLPFSLNVNSETSETKGCYVNLINSDQVHKTQTIFTTFRVISWFI